MAVLASMMAGAMVFSSFTAPKQEVKETCSQNVMGVPIYWEGVARTLGRDPSLLEIRVYQTEGQCNSYYAVVKSGRHEGKELWVKENPDFDGNTFGGSKSNYKYYVTCIGDYYFNM